MNLLGGISRFTPYATVCMMILICAFLDLYHVMIFESLGMLLTVMREMVRDTTCECELRKCHRTLYEGGAAEDPPRSHGGLRGKRTPSKGL